MIAVVYNNINAILDVLHSVSSLLHINLEHIFVDAESASGTTEVLHECAHMMDRLIIEPDMSIYDAMNTSNQRRLEFLLIT